MTTFKICFVRVVCHVVFNLILVSTDNAYKANVEFYYLLASTIINTKNKIGNIINIISNSTIPTNMMMSFSTR